MKLNLKWVSQTIGDDYKNWNKGDTVLIQAQTGTGKTHFIKNQLLDYLGSGERLLFVCNRTNLKRQLKKDLLKKYNQTIPDSLNELDKITTIADKVTITSYHAISETVKNEIYQKKNAVKCDFTMFDYIILDECHFILADGSFNNKTRFAYDKIVREWHSNVVKIFISATMHEIRNPIVNCIDFNKSKGFGLDNYKLREYSTGIDYSYCHPQYFKKMDSIINLIKNDTSDDKWLIFITDIQRDGHKIIEEVGEGKCSLIQSGTISDELNSIINNSKFNKKVLICTKAMDNGINISDKKLKNIVVMAWDQISFIQMLGRKRIDIENAEDVNLFIPTRYKKSFMSKLHNYLVKKEELKLHEKENVKFCEKYDNDLEMFNGLNDIFYRDYLTGQIEVNMIGNKRLYEDIKFADKMIKAFDELGEFAFIYEQLSWLGLKFEPDKLLDDVVLDEETFTLNNYLTSIIGEKLFSNEQQELSNLIIKELVTISNKTDYRTKKLKPTTLETIIRDQLGLPYAVSAPKKETKGEMVGKRYIIITKLK